MMLLKALMIILIAAMLVTAHISCSGSSRNQSPIEPSNQSNDLPTSFGTEDTSGRSVLAVYDAMIDPVAKTFTVTPSERIADYHFPLTQLCPDVLQIVDYGWTPNFWADIKITHPYPGSGISAYDPRVIAILPANPGVRFIYPSLGVGGNNKALYDADGYTKLFDKLGGSITGNVNPFKAYFKSQPYRVWSSTGATSETRRWNLNLAGFGDPLVYKLVVDVSTNYPDPPTPITDNALEPVKIDATVGEGLSQQGGTADLTVTLLDWQGQMTVGGVKAEAPDLFDGTVSLSYFGPGLNPNEYIYKSTISNAKLAPAGEYKYLVAAWDQAIGLYMYNEFSVSVIYVPSERSLIWAKRAGGSNNDYGYGITTLSDNSTVVTGRFLGTATFGKGETNETKLTSFGGMDIFVARFNSDGTLSWAKRAGGSGWDKGWGITTLSDNSTVIAGLFYGTAIFGPGEPNQTILTSSGEYDIFIARHNQNGTLSWAKRAGGSGEDSGYGITKLSDNSTILTGDFAGTATFGLGEPNQTILTSYGNSDIFIARYNSDGALLWAKQAGGLDWDWSSSGIKTLSDNSIVLTGDFMGIAAFGLGEPRQTILTSSGGYDIFIAQYYSSGALALAKSAGGSDDDRGWSIATLPDNSIVVTGNFSGIATFGAGEPNQTILTCLQYSDIFIARYNPSGTLAWAKRAGGQDDYDRAYGITSLSDNSTVVTGRYEGVATFGEGEPNQTTLFSAGYRDIFVAKYNPDGTLSWAKRAGGSGWDCGIGIITLSDNSIVVAGCFESTATLGPGEPNETILTSAGYTDIFVARFEP